MPARKGRTRRRVIKKEDENCQFRKTKMLGDQHLNWTMSCLVDLTTILTLMTFACWSLMSGDECQVPGSAIHDRLILNGDDFIRYVDVNVNVNCWMVVNMLRKRIQNKNCYCNLLSTFTVSAELWGKKRA